LQLSTSIHKYNYISLDISEAGTEARSTIDGFFMKGGPLRPPKKIQIGYVIEFMN
jgi:hypothetical protein